jgi:hypothetical protein
MMYLIHLKWSREVNKIIRTKDKIQIKYCMNKLLREYYEIRDKHDLLMSRLGDETSRIVKVICKVFKEKNYWWSFKYYESESDDAPLPQEINKDTEYGNSFLIHISRKCDSGRWVYNEAIPIKFFDMSNEEIEKYIKLEIEEVEEEEQKELDVKAKKKEEKQAKKNALKQTAIEKLSKEERKALGV